MHTSDNLDSVLSYFFDKAPQRLSISEISKSVFNNDTTIPVSEVIVHLVEEKYLFPELTDYAMNIQDVKYGISIKGILFFENSKIERRPYYALENEKKQLKTRVDVKHDHSLNVAAPEWWGKKYWWIMLIIGWVGGCWSNMVREKLSNKEKTETVVDSKNEKVNKADSSKVPK